MAMKNYEKMSRMEKKVAIAKDVIVQIKAKQLKISAGIGYVVGELAEDLEIVKKHFSSQELASKMQKECVVCACGAMMLCKIIKYNNYNFDNYIEFNHTLKALEDAFTSNELDLIESCFECDDFTQDGSIDFDIIDKWSRIKNDEDRLMAIMQNIVDHKGVFRPEVEYKIVKS